MLKWKWMEEVAMNNFCSVSKVGQPFLILSGTFSYNLWMPLGTERNGPPKVVEQKLLRRLRRLKCMRAGSYMCPPAIGTLA